MSSSIPHSEPKSEICERTQHVITSEILAIPNVTFCDCSTDTDNVFIKKYKSISEHLYGSGRFLISLAGTGELWKGWIGIWPELRLNDLKVSQENYTPAPPTSAAKRKKLC